MDTTNLISWLPFDSSTTEDFCGNTWTTSGSPVIQDTQLNLPGSSSYLAMGGGIAIGGQNFTIRGKFNMDSATDAWGRLFEFNADGGSSRFELIRNNKNNYLNINGYQSLASSQFETAINTSVLNQTVDIEIDYAHDAGKLYVFYDGVLKLTVNVTFTRQQIQYVFLGASKYQSNRCFVGSIDEFQIFDGVALHTEDFTPPTEEDYLQGKLTFGSANFNFTANIERKVSTVFELNADIEIRIWKRWWYINPGNADDLIIASTVLTDLPETQSRTGTGFYQTTRAKCFDLPATDEVWIKFDVYFNGSNRWRAYNDEGDGTLDGISAQQTSSATGTLSFFASTTQSIYKGENFTKKNQLQTVLLHMISGSSDGVIEAWVDGVKIHTYTGDVNHGEDFADIYLQSDGAGTFFSNVIISNVEISLNDGGITFFNKVDVERVLTNADWSPVASLKVWLPFNKSITEDLGGNDWQIVSPDNYTLSLTESDAIHYTALQINPDKLSGLYTSYRCLRMKNGITLGGRSFTIKGWFSIHRIPTQAADYWGIFTLSSAASGSILPHNSTIALGGKAATLYLACFGEITRITNLETSKVYAFELVYLHGLGKFFTFLNGEKVATVDITIPPTFFPNVYIEYAYWLPEHPGITIDEFRIYDGAALHTESFTAPTVENYIADTLALEKQCPFGFHATTECEIINNRQTVHRYIAFTGASGCYGVIPLETLAGKTTFTIEVEFSTTSTANYSNNYQWKTIIGRELQGFWQDDFGLCVNNGKLCFWAEPKSEGKSSGVNTISDTTINDGAIHKVAVVSNADGTIDLYCDGKLVTHNYIATNAKISDSYAIGIASNINDSNSYLAMKFYEARLWSVARTREEIFTDIEGGGVLFTDIEGNEEGLEAWHVPDARTDIIPDMTGHERHVTLHGDPTVSFVYEMNFDYTVPIECEIYFLADSPSDVFSILEGGGFYQTEIKKCFNLPPTYNIWIDFDVYFDGEHRWRAGNAGANGITGATSQTSGEISFVDCDETIKSVADVCKKKTVQNVCLHMIADGENGLIEARVDGKTVYTYRGSVNQGEPFSDIFLQSDGEGTYFTSILVSTSEKPPERERTYDFNVVRKVLNASIMWTQSWEYALWGFGLSPMPLELPSGEGSIVYILSQPEIKKIFDLPPTYDIWIDFDVYFDGESKWRAGNVNDNGICGLVALTTSPLLYLSNDETVQAVPNVCKAGKTYPILLHMKAGETDGVIETWVNGEKLYTYTGDVNHGEDFYDLFLQCDTEGTYFYNVIFSTDRLEPRCYIEPIYFCVYHNGEVLFFPLHPSDTSATPALAIRYGGENWYNKLCAPSDEKAGTVHIWHNNTEYALSKIL